MSGQTEGYKAYRGRVHLLLEIAEKERELGFLTEYLDRFPALQPVCDELEASRAALQQQMDNIETSAQSQALAVLDRWQLDDDEDKRLVAQAFIDTQRVNFRLIRQYTTCQDELRKLKGPVG